MKRYFKKAQVAGPLAWTSFYEYDGRWVSRHLDVCPEIVIVYSELERSEAPVEAMGPGTEISPSEFEAAWERFSKIPHGTRRTDHPLVRRDLGGCIPLPPVELTTDLD